MAAPEASVVDVEGDVDVQEAAGGSTWSSTSEVERAVAALAAE